MGLYERITDTTGDTKIAVHSLGAALRELARGNATLAQLIAVFNLDAEDETDLTAIRDAYVALSTDMERASYLGLMEDAFLLAEVGIYDKTKVKSVLGF